MEAEILIQVKTPSNGKNASAVFVLSRGNNTGKVLDVPSPNCFIINAPAGQLKTVRAVAQILFASGEIRKKLLGSVIPFVRVDDYRKLFLLFWRSLPSDTIATISEKMLAIEKLVENQTNQIKNLKALHRALALSALK